MTIPMGMGMVKSTQTVMGPRALSSPFVLGPRPCFHEILPGLLFISYCFCALGQWGLRVMELA